jgi:hypothetical protein
VRYLDRVFARLFDLVPPNTYITVTADHGELFGEDGYFGHGPINHEKYSKCRLSKGKSADGGVETCKHHSRDRKVWCALGVGSEGYERSQSADWDGISVVCLAIVVNGIEWSAVGGALRRTNLLLCCRRLVFSP